MKYCSKCGSSNNDDAAFCASCGTPLEQAQAMPTPPAPPTPPVYEAPVTEAPASQSYTAPVDNSYSTQPQGNYDTGAAYTAPASTEAAPKNDTTLWLILNIACALLCCLPLGAAGAILAGMASSSYTKGDYADATKKTKTAKILFIVGIVVGILVIIISLAAGLIPAIIAATNY